jgi:hypothetical protein
MQGGEAGRDLQAEVRRATRRQRTEIEHRPQRLAVQELRDDVGRRVSADVEDSEHVRLGKRGDGPRFLLEAALPHRSLPNDVGRTLIATSRPRRGSWAR